jgi:hypothetical protein
MLFRRSRHFWNSAIAPGREVEEFGDAVVLREYSADDRTTLLNYQLPRGIFVNGEEIGWGYEAPKNGIRNAISQRMG